MTTFDRLIIGCGYVGRRVAMRWQDEGKTIAALTRSPQRAEEFRVNGITPILGDVTEPASLADLPSADQVLCAVGFDRGSGRSKRTVYIDGLRNLLSEMKNEWNRFIYISSTSVYGQEAGEWVDEDSPCQPTTESGQICLDAEEVLRSHDDLPARSVILRLAGIYGPGRLLRRVESLRSREPITGHPDSFLNLIHVDDAVETVSACEERGRDGEVYLVSDDRPVTRREYFDLLAERVGAAPPQFTYQDRSGGPARGRNKRCSNRKIREELKILLRFPTIESGLPAAIASKDATESN